MSYTASSVPIIMYVLGLFVVVYKTNKYDQSYKVIYILTKFHDYV